MVLIHCLDCFQDQGLNTIIDPVAQQEFEDDIEDLVSLNLFHKKNMMAVSELMDLEGKDASGLGTWTSEEILQSAIEFNDVQGVSAQDDTEVELPSKPAYSDLHESSNGIIDYLRHEKSEEARACGKAVCKVLQQLSAAYSKKSTQPYPLLSFFSQAAHIQCVVASYCSSYIVLTKLN